MIFITCFTTQDVLSKEIDTLTHNPEWPFAHYVTSLKQDSVTDMAFQERAIPNPGKYQDELSSETSNRVMLHLSMCITCNEPWSFTDP